MSFRTPAIGSVEASVESARPRVRAQRHDTRMLLPWTTLGFLAVLAVLGSTPVALFVLTPVIAGGWGVATIAGTVAGIFYTFGDGRVSAYVASTAAGLVLACLIRLVAAVFM